MDSVNVSFYPLHESVQLPDYGTSMSACFDFRFFPGSRESVSAYDKHNIPVERTITNGVISIYPKDRVLVPTGLIIRIQPNQQEYSLRLHGRSGLALKKGLILANAEGIVDMDYNQEIFAMIGNISDSTQSISVGERICQGEIVRNCFVLSMVRATEPFEPLSERSGGFGHTGTL